MTLSDLSDFIMSDVRGWTALVIAVGIAALVALNRVRGPIICRALTASITAALPGACFWIEIWLFRADKELFSLNTFGFALLWIVIGFIALIKSFNLWPLSRQLGYYQVIRILCVVVWGVSSFAAWLGALGV